MSIRVIPSCAKREQSALLEMTASMPSSGSSLHQHSVPAQNSSEPQSRAQYGAQDRQLASRARSALTRGAGFATLATPQRHPRNGP